MTTSSHRTADGEPGAQVSAALLDKVRKLLAKAEATDNGHEADAFSAKAAALIASHRIDMARLRDVSADDRLAMKEVLVGRGAYVRARLALLQSVAEAHDCELVWQSGPDGATALLAGFRSDLDAIVMLYESLHLQAAGQMAAVRRPTPAATQRWRRAFLFGYADRVAELLREARRQAEATAAANTTLLPDVPARADRVREFAASAFGRVIGARAPRPAAAGGWDHGHRAAAGADIGRARLAGRRALGRGRS